MVQPQIMVGYAHLVKGDLLSVLEEAVGPPNLIEPVHIEDPVLLVHVLREAQPRIPPGLCQEYIGYISLKF